MATTASMHFTRTRRRISLALGLFYSGVALPAAVLTTSYQEFDGNPSLPVPDGNPSGVSDTRTVNSGLGDILSISISLNLSSEFNGDLYVYLRHNDQMAVLLNRPGRSASDSFGYADQGLNISLSDSLLENDIHFYQNNSTPAPGAALTGTWQADGRSEDPDRVTELNSPNTPLSVFHGLNPDGDWTLFVADLSSGGASSLQGWGLQITAVPEPLYASLAGGVALLAFGLYRRLGSSASRRV